MWTLLGNYEGLRRLVTRTQNNLEAILRTKKQVPTALLALHQNILVRTGENEVEGRDSLQTTIGFFFVQLCHRASLRGSRIV